MNFQPKKSQIIAGIVLLVVIGILPFSTTTIPANHVGIVYNAFNGGVQDKTLPNGFYFKKPFFDKIYTMPTSVNSVNIEKVTTQTKDAQYIDTTLDVKYQVEGDNALTVFKQFQTIERVNAELVNPIVQKAVEQVTVDYDVLEILGEKRNEVYAKIDENVQKELSKFGLTYKSLVIVDSDAKDEIERAIQDEAVAQQQVHIARQHQEKVKVDTETAILQEQANAEKTKIRANAEAEANKTISNSLTPDLVKYKEIEARMKHGWIEVITQDAIIDTTNQ
ncbi:prohibitin family protein [Aerococcaceae bacterium NML191292]|nr:prohibitin family protein [Aerococcaceae bacterium NML191292]MCW6661410.1 prohibitin family protein [Aerococcaceae bacterium NML201209]MCW6664987.1 prohibitin family protein [Aerococcaceae bacterium NML191219]MCW6667297.1 prohibitin family protein [Aerococcaceae bacterium NML190938]MCW6675231.1 prohibitin family protein [Aerococcaceae bacterium NML171108]MCW6677153.1 prohibitin family protein [Aerococcaceae bacterium NML180378]MCW6680786.1 prohibitin family protein [Aerococcaceae bacterium